VIIQISLAVIIMLFTAQAHAACLAWMVCPYEIDPTDPRARMLSILDTNLAQYGVIWKSFDIEGGEDEAGVAAVCVQAVNPGSQAVAIAVVQAEGCIIRTKAQMRLLAKPAFESYWDENTGTIRFKDGKGGRLRKKIKRFISVQSRDDLVTEE
jgi:hypothetical protein